MILHAGEHSTGCGCGIRPASSTSVQPDRPIDIGFQPLVAMPGTYRVIDGRIFFVDPGEPPR